ncbi:MAG: hypothetical protein JNM70_06740 [Anaerolineae bacterium]|nr:hypothetical protein [Anaerolineae bacterium]
MKARLILPGLLLLVLLAAACTPAPNLRNEKFLKDSSLIESSEDCEAPCWRGITPGVTTWSDALTILEDAPDLENPETQTVENSPVVGAQWKPVDGDPCCQMVSEDGEVVSSLFIQLAPNQTMSQLIEAQGEPTYVLGTPGTDDQAILNLFYPDKGMVVFAFVTGAANGELTESSEIIGVFYTTLERMDLTVKLSNLYAWDGYRPFSAYAPDNPDVQYAVTQSVTLTPTPTPGQ